MLPHTHERQEHVVTALAGLAQARALLGACQRLSRGFAGAEPNQVRAYLEFCPLLTVTDVLDGLALCGLCRSQRVRHSRSPRAHRLTCTSRRIARSLMFHLGVNLCPDQDDNGRNPKPSHEADHSSQ